MGSVWKSVPSVIQTAFAFYDRDTSLDMMKLVTIVIMTFTIAAMLWIIEAEIRNAEKIDAHSLQDRTDCKAKNEPCASIAECCGDLVCWGMTCRDRLTKF